MPRNPTNTSLSNARKSKSDEFYTQLPDIEREIIHYRKHFKNKVVFCNCDDPRVSNFFHYFSYNFEKLKLKKLITTCYKNQDMDLFSRHDTERAIYLEYEGDKNENRVPDSEEIGIKQLKEDGDFRSKECIELLKQSDIVVTNPPFSLFREYIEQLVKYNKKFLMIGSWNAISYKEVFPLLMKNKIWIGHNSGVMVFKMPNYSESKRMGNICWFTNLDISKRHEDLILYEKYTPEKYPTYDNYNAININKIKDIPIDYEGVMGVPINFMDKYNPEQFEIMGLTVSWSDMKIKIYPPQIQVGIDGIKKNVAKLNHGAALKLDSPPHGKTYYIVGTNYYVLVYVRILIRKITS